MKADDRSYVVQVGFCSSRPLRPDEHTTHVRVAADSDGEAILIAAQVVGAQIGEWMGRPHVEMVT